MGIIPNAVHSLRLLTCLRHHSAHQGWLLMRLSLTKPNPRHRGHVLIPCSYLNGEERMWPRDFVVYRQSSLHALPARKGEASSSEGVGESSFYDSEGSIGGLEETRTRGQRFVSKYC